ncbi:hypothetical protein C8R46DRAFT_1030702 [Mycena filopes]|nr:hypothetical protein C8R46DRAFT_1030702 [Mycena filopes]
MASQPIRKKYTEENQKKLTSLGMWGEHEHMKELNIENLAPIELWNEILASVARDRDNNLRSVVERLVDRYHIMATCHTFAILTRATSEMWANFYFAKPHKNNPFVPPTAHKFHAKRALAKSKLLQIAWALPIELDPTGPNAVIWADIIQTKAQWRSLFLHAPSTCSAASMCPLGIMSAHPSVSTAPALRQLGVITENCLRDCHHSHPQLTVNAAQMEVYVEPTETTQNAFKGLTTLDVGCHRSPDWESILSLSSNLHTLRWRAGNSGWSNKTVMGGLRELAIYVLTEMPPVVAPNLETLIIADSRFGITSDEITSIIGRTGDVPTLRVLNLLNNPSTNAETSNIIKRCSKVQIVRIHGSHEQRTQIYRQLEARAILGYLRNNQRRLLIVHFSVSPPNNAGYAAARRSLARLQSRGFTDKEKIRFNLPVYRARVPGCTGPFNHAPDGPDVNNMHLPWVRPVRGDRGQRVIEGKARPPRYSLILAFTDANERARIMDHGVMVNGAMKTQVVAFDSGWNETIQFSEVDVRLFGKEWTAPTYPSKTRRYTVESKASKAPVVSETRWGSFLDRLEVKVGHSQDVETRRSWYGTTITPADRRMLAERLIHLTLDVLGAKRTIRACPGCTTQHREYYTFRSIGSFECLSGIIQFWLGELGQDVVKQMSGPDRQRAESIQDGDVRAEFKGFGHA